MADLDAAHDILGIRRGPQDEMVGTPVVNPDGCAVGGEQTVGAVAEDVEPGSQVEGGREARGELVEQLADVPLHVLALTQADQLERGHEGVAGLAGIVGDVGRGGRCCESDGEQADTLGPPNERQEQRGVRAQPRGEIGRLTRRVGDQRRFLALERVGDA
jgi:hypothetical protein